MYALSDALCCTFLETDYIYDMISVNIKICYFAYINLFVHYAVYCLATVNIVPMAIGAVF